MMSQDMLDAFMEARRTLYARKLKIMHVSMQWSDSFDQQRQDARRVFEKGADVITGTEAGTGDGGRRVRKALRQAARDAGYILHIHKKADTFVAVKRGTGARNVTKGYVKVMPGAGKDPYGAYGQRGIVYQSFDMADIGRVTVGAVHYLTKGRFKTQTRLGPLNRWAKNKLYARAIGKWAAQVGAGDAIAFVAGDFNMLDGGKKDLFFGEPLTTCWDELGKHPSTGYGTLDAIASYDFDGRVSCVDAEAYNDSKLFLHTDHFAIRAVYKVKEKA